MPVGVHRNSLYPALTYGNCYGFIVGLNGASVDIVYALVAAFSITLISDFVTGLQHWIRLAGGVLLFILGLCIFRSYPCAQAPRPSDQMNIRRPFSPRFFSPHESYDAVRFCAVFSSVRTRQTGDDRIFLPMLVAGVFFGSLSWFSLLTSLTYVFKKNITGGGLSIVNRIAGCLLMFFGIIAIGIGANRF
jgi:threonine/homoserine/homoserine lactone efflux protein